MRRHGLVGRAGRRSLVADVRTWAAVAVTLALAGACAGADVTDSADAEGTLTSPSSTVTVTLGSAPPVRVEIADTPEERAHGLMGRDEVPPDTGMLFVFDEPSTSDFFMYRTRVPLSLAFIDEGRVVGVREMRPCRADDPDDCPRYGVDVPYTLAVEAPGGHFTAAGVDVGDAVTIEPPLRQAQ